VGKAETERRVLQDALSPHHEVDGYLEADLATPLESIHRFCDLLRTRSDLLLVMGSRVALLGRQIRRSGVRHFVGRAFATAASLVLRLPVYDTQCGAKLFRVTPVTHQLFARPFRSRWIFDVEILARMVWAMESVGGESARNTIYEYPLEEWQDVRGSRLKALDFLIAGLDLAAICWQTRRPRVHVPRIASNIAHSASDIQRQDAA
jgi:hypothetical protein